MNKKYLFLALVIAFSMCAAFAYQFSPLDQSFEPTGVNSQKVYTIVNDSEDQIAIELAVYERSQDEYGNEIRTNASKEFRITPASKVVVQPQSTMVITVKYLGTSTVTVEKSYRLLASQIAYSQGKSQTSQSMFNFMYNYATSLYVVPSQTVENVSVASTKAVVDAEGNQLLELRFRNSGNVHQHLRELSLTVADTNGNTVTIDDPTTLAGVDSMLILARKTITKTIPWPEGLPFNASGRYSTTLEYTN